MIPDPNSQAAGKAAAIALDERAAEIATVLENRGAEILKRLETQATATAAQLAQQFRATTQRKVNLIWEFTQASIAVLVTGSVIYAALRSKETVASLLLIGNAFTFIISLYFARTKQQERSERRDEDSR